MWNYDVHLLALIALDAGTEAVLGPDPEPAVEEARLAAMRVIVAAPYALAGLSKVIHGGESWLRNGASLQVALTAFGTERGRELARRPALTRVLAPVTVLGELAATPLLLSPWRRLGGLGAVIFHAGSKRHLDISFWHLANLHVPLTLLSEGQVARLSHVAAAGCRTARRRSSIAGKPGSRRAR